MLKQNPQLRPHIYSLQVSSMLGHNHAGVGWLLQCLGAHVGKRIFWPGSGINIVEYDLLTVEDDCVFGSRSSFYPSSM